MRQRLIAARFLHRSIVLGLCKTAARVAIRVASRARAGENVGVDVSDHHHLRRVEGLFQAVLAADRDDRNALLEVKCGASSSIGPERGIASSAAAIAGASTST
jgi:hypothetical protein